MSKRGTALGTTPCSTGRSTPSTVGCRRLLTRTGLRYRCRARAARSPRHLPGGQGGSVGSRPSRRNAPTGCLARQTPEVERRDDGTGIGGFGDVVDVSDLTVDHLPVGSP